MKLSTLIATRLMRNRSKRSLSRFIIRLSIGATALSVAVMICATAFVNGFQHSISDKVFRFWGHVRVLNNIDQEHGLMEEVPMEKNLSIEKLLKENAGIQSVSEYATKSALLQTSGSLESILFKGLSSPSVFFRQQSFIQKGKWISFTDSMYSKEIMLSTYTAKQLQLNPGDSLIVHFFRNDGSKTARRLIVSGIYKTGIEEYDKNFGICDIRLIRRLNQWPDNQIGGYEVILNDYKEIDRLNKKIYSLLPQGWYSKTIKEVYPNIFDWLQLQDQIKELLFIIMIVIAIMNLITCLIILLLDRTQMIAILGTLGSDAGMIQKIFLINSAYIAGVGVLLGTIFGLAICYIQNTTGLIQLNEEAYYITAAQADVNLWQVLGIDIATIIICTLFLWLPTFLIRRMKIIHALRKF